MAQKNKKGNLNNSNNAKKQSKTKQIRGNNFKGKRLADTIAKAINTRKKNDIIFNRKSWNFGKRGKETHTYGKKYGKKTRKKDSEAKMGNKNPMYGKKGTLSPNIKQFKVTNPQGKVFYTINGLTEFCEQNNLSMKNMSAVARGTRNHHKQWKCEYLIKT